VHHREPPVWLPRARVAGDLEAGLIVTVGEQREASVPEKLSLLLPVWAGDRPDYLTAAFTSSVQDQTRPPDQVVIVRDGPVPPALAATIAALAADSPVPVEVVELPGNVGLGPALDAGLAACTHDVVARMDADDISLPHRFAVQMPIIEAGHDLVGSGLVEFGANADDIVGTRTPPTTPDDIRTRARFADPFNHPTVVYRRDLVRAVGGYTDFALMEDYLLWAKMLVAGARVANVAEPLVRYRVGAGAYARRGGKAQLRAELRLQWRFRRIGFTTWAQFLRNVVVRGTYRLVPEEVRRALYRKVIATYRA
jgi:glycosyltransferase involved in cell wall biosynthesis